jgi:hypothetical protein
MDMPLTHRHGTTNIPQHVTKYASHMADALGWTVQGGKNGRAHQPATTPAVAEGTPTAAEKALVKA